MPKTCDVSNDEVFVDIAKEESELLFVCVCVRFRAAEARGRGHGSDQPGHETGGEEPD